VVQMEACQSELVAGLEQAAHEVGSPNEGDAVTAAGSFDGEGDARWVLPAPIGTGDEGRGRVAPPD